MWDWFKKGWGVPENARNFGEIMAHMGRGVQGQWYHRFLETPIGEQEEARFTEADYAPEHLDVLREMARLAREKGRSNIDYPGVSAPMLERGDYGELLRRRQALHPEEAGERLNPYLHDLDDISRTIGGGQFETRDGNVYAKDQYDFNQYYMGKALEEYLGLGGPGSEKTSDKLDAAMKKADFSWSDLRALVGATPYTEENLQNALEKSGWPTERNFPWWTAIKSVLSAPFTGKPNYDAALLGRLHSPPFKETSIPVDINLGTAEEVYGPLHRGYRPKEGIIGREK